MRKPRQGGHGPTQLGRHRSRTRLAQAEQLPFVALAALVRLRVLSAAAAPLAAAAAANGDAFGTLPSLRLRSG